MSRLRLIPIRAAFVLATAALLTAGCGEGAEREIVDTRELARPITLPAGRDDPATRLGFVRRDQGGDPHAGHVQGGAAAKPSYSWKLPEGWVELPPAQFREGNFRIGSARASEAVLSVLPAAGGGLVANLNRWRRQMGRPPMSAEEMGALGTSKVLGRDAMLVEFTGDFVGMGTEPKKGYKLVGLLLEDQGHGVFLKLTGPEAEVDAEKERFLALAASLKRKQAAPPPAAHGGGHGGPAFDVPEGWVQARTKQMAAATFTTGGEKPAECSIFLFPVRQGSLEANINRWRAQIGQGPLAPAEIANLPKVKMLGQEGTLLEVKGSYGGMSNVKREGSMLLGVICELPRQVVYVKMTGPEHVVTAERESFLRLCASLR